MSVVFPTTHQQSRYALYRLTKKEKFLLLDRKREPTPGDLVINNCGEPRIARYRGQSILGVVTLLKWYWQLCL